MLKTILTLSALFAVAFLFGQSEEDEIQILYEANQYVTDTYKCDFTNKFNTNDSRKDYKNLREYLRDKKRLHKFLIEKIEPIYGYGTKEEAIRYLESEIKRCERFLNMHDGGENDPLKKFYIQYTDIDGINRYYDAFDSKIYPYDVDSSIIPELKQELERFEKSLQREKLILENLRKINIDISSCEEHLDSALTAEYKDQDFRSNISFYFTWLIGVLLFGFFAIIFLKSDKSIGSVFLTGHGLQFVSLFVLIIAVILFGILGILEGKELTAILSGISGYILGKGVSGASESRKVSMASDKVSKDNAQNNDKMNE